jgi:hypothetical protein
LYRKWLPVAIVTLGYVFVANIFLRSLYFLYTFYAHHEREPLEIALSFKSLLEAMFLKSPDHIGITSTLSLALVGIGTWLVSTRVQYWNSRSLRVVMFATVLGAAMLEWWVHVSRQIYDHILPYIHEKAEVYQTATDPNTVRLEPIQNMGVLDAVLLSLPALPLIIMLMSFYKKWKMHEEEMNEWFFNWKFQSPRLGPLFDTYDREQYPDIIIGTDVETGELVVQKGKDRNLNNLITGSIGTGKTSARIIPEANQDMNYMVKMINHVDWKLLKDVQTKMREGTTITDEEYQRYEDELDKLSRSVNGLIVVEPSNDLCQQLYQLAKAHGIPQEAVYYLNPLDPNTLSINPLYGPTEKVVEMFTMVIQGLAKNQDEFFKQAQRSHLKHYLYLLKLYKGNDCTFDDLMNMYHDARFVYEIMEKVEKTIPENWEDIKDRDVRNHWMIVSGIISWFRERGLMFVTDRDGLPVLYPNGTKHAGKPMVVDKQGDFVQGLRNILDDIASSKLIRRVLFGKSDFNIDIHLRAGGILLLNTAKGDLADLSDTLGKFVLLMVQNAIFRRGRWTKRGEDGSLITYTDYGKENYHHLIVDEFPDYIFEQFRSLPTQSRKYKAIITVASQSLAQLALTFGDNFMYTLMSAFRHKMVYGDVDPKTAKIYSEWFGEEEVYEQTHSTMINPDIMSNPERRDNVSTMKRRKARLSPSDIIHLKEFHGAIKLVEDNRSMPVRIVKANFVPKEEFIKAKIRVREEKGKEWMEYREFLKGEFIDDLLSDTEILKEGKANPIDAYPAKTIEEELQRYQIVKAAEYDTVFRMKAQDNVIDISEHRGRRTQKEEQTDDPIITRQLDSDAYFKAMMSHQDTINQIAAEIKKGHVVMEDDPEPENSGHHLTQDELYDDIKGH